jgi:hypothetical protein
MVDLGSLARLLPEKKGVEHLWSHMGNTYTRHLRRILGNLRIAHHGAKAVNRVETHFYCWCLSLAACAGSILSATRTTQLSTGLSGFSTASIIHIHIPIPIVIAIIGCLRSKIFIYMSL